MANIREIRHRIKSIRETKQITKAMKLISAAKLKKARLQLEQTLPYFNKVKMTIADILVHSGEVNNTFFDVRHEKQGKRKGYLIITGDKGMAGSYNHNIIKLAECQLNNNPGSLLFVAGNAGRSHFLKGSYHVYEDFDYPITNPTVYRAREITEMILELFSKGELDEVYLIYTVTISSMKLEPEVMRLLPLDPEALKEDLKRFINIDAVMDASEEIDNSLLYEPSARTVFDVLIPKYVKGMVYGALVEAFTSEQSARMTAMDNATANADEILIRLNLSYNRARQAAITQEISEIVSGAAALK